MNLEVSSWTKYFGTGDQEGREYRSQEFGTRLQEVRSGTNHKKEVISLTKKSIPETRKSERGSKNTEGASVKRD
jgi:hypothetical protein